MIWFLLQYWTVRIVFEAVKVLAGMAITMTVGVGVLAASEYPGGGTMIGWASVLILIVGLTYIIRPIVLERGWKDAAAYIALSCTPAVALILIIGGAVWMLEA